MRWLALFFAVPLLAQGLDEAAFKGEAAKVSVACAERARLLKPKDGKLLAEYGRAYLMAGQRAKAEECFQQARIEDSRDAETHRLIAYAWLKTGHRAEALKALEDMQLVDPKAKSAFARAAVNLNDAGLSKEADTLMDRAWILDPSEWQFSIAFGRSCLRKQRRDAAARWFARAVQAKPQEERAWNAIALAYADHGAETN